jgi:hypothetical protein
MPLLVVKINSILGQNLTLITILVVLGAQTQDPKQKS